MKGWIVRSLLALVLLPPSIGGSGAVHAQAASTAAESGVQVRKPRLMLVPASAVNATAAQQYAQMKQQAQARRVLNVDAPQVQRVRAIAQRLIPHGTRFNPQAAQWHWEVNVIDAPQINAFCMPSGKIMVFDGLINTLKLGDDELAAVIGHEIAHALLEHGRARMSPPGRPKGESLGAQREVSPMSEQVLKGVGINLAAAYFGLSDLGTAALAQATQLAITQPYSRSHETDADLVGLELAARAGYDPRAALSLWRKMAAASKGQPPQFLSTHPGHAQRIGEIERNLPRVMGLHAAGGRDR
jgi:Zn-dependent protease with chaperone function